MKLKTTPSKQEVRLAAANLLRLRTLGGGKEPAQVWQRNRLEDLRVVQSRAREAPRSLGHHQLGQVTVYLHRTVDYADMAETLLHEIVHCVMMGRPQDEDAHSPRFWAMMTLCAQEMWHIRVLLTRDGQLADALRKFPSRLANTFKEAHDAR